MTAPTDVRRVHRKIVTLTVTETELQSQLKSVRTELTAAEAEFETLTTGSTRAAKIRKAGLSGAQKAARTKRRNAQIAARAAKKPRKPARKTAAVLDDPATLPNRTRALLRSASKPLTCAAVAEKLDVTPLRAAGVLHEMSKRKEVAREKLMNGGNAPVFHYQLATA